MVLVDTFVRGRLVYLVAAASLAAAGCGGGGPADMGRVAGEVKTAFQRELDRRLDGTGVSATVRTVDCVKQSDTTARCMATVTARDVSDSQTRNVPVDVTMDPGGGKLIWQTPDLETIFR